MMYTLYSASGILKIETECSAVFKKKLFLCEDCRFYTRVIWCELSENIVYVFWEIIQQHCEEKKKWILESIVGLQAMETL